MKTSLEHSGRANGHALTAERSGQIPPGRIDPAAKVRADLSRSDFLATVASVREDGGLQFAVGALRVRPLFVEEIAQLESLGNIAADWSRVRVADGFDWRRVRHTAFQGDVVLGRFTRSVRLVDSVEVPAGVCHATVANCIIGNDALVKDVRLLANYVLGESAELFDCGRIVCDGETYFGNGETLPIAIETGGRDLAIYAELDVDQAAQVARSGGGRVLRETYSAAVAEYRERAGSRRGIVARSAVIRNTPEVRNSYLGPCARVEAATLVAESTLLSSADEPTVVQSGSCVSGSLLQWGSQVSSLALVDRSVLVEHARVERHAKVTASILGPNTGVAAGEVTSCLLGPFVSSHHQALLIATLWPEGRGNVSYGANVGSNHTSKAPDQEFWPGEGAFFGLGVNIKFPSDFTRAPYTIIACGVTTLPQKLAFPFSLVNKPSALYPGISPAYNEIIPAWLLTDNLYTIRRSEAKFRARDRARRAQFDFNILRPEIVDLMVDACHRLEAVSRPRDSYTEREIEGLGKNYLVETHRLRAIEAYRFYAQYYALLALKTRVEEVQRQEASSAVYGLLCKPADDPRWEHARSILHDVFCLSDVCEALRLLPAMLERVACAVERSKAKDDERGTRIIDDYAEVHVPAVRDPLVQACWKETGRLQSEVAELLLELDAGGEGVGLPDGGPLHPDGRVNDVAVARIVRIGPTDGLAVSARPG